MSFKFGAFLPLAAIATLLSACQTDPAPGPSDASPIDAATDRGPADTGQDVGLADRPSDVAVDVAPNDVGVAPIDAGTDTGTPDSGLADAGLADTGPADAGPADAGPADTGPADVGTPDAGAPYASFRSVAAGGLYTCALDAAGAAWCWGQANMGQTGAGTSGGSQFPAAVVGGHVFTLIRAGGATTCALMADGAAYCWGGAFDGNIGNGTSGFAVAFGVSSPALVSGGHPFRTLSVGGDHACGVTTAGEAWCWGHNVQGELGINSQTMSTVPAQVMGGQSWSAIAAGSDFTCGLTTAGAAWCWGTNGDGRLGTGALAPVRALTPVAVTGGYTFTAIAVGERFACALTTAGATYCWGANNYSQLGLGGADTSAHPTPTLVGGSQAFTSITLGTQHVCGLTSAGAAYCWGYGIFGQLGVGGSPPVANGMSPAAVMGGYTFTSMAAGLGHTCGATAGITYCWGGNGQYQLGIRMGVATTPSPVLAPGS